MHTIFRYWRSPKIETVCITISRRITKPLIVNPSNFLSVFTNNSGNTDVKKSG